MIQKMNRRKMLRFVTAGMLVPTAITILPPKKEWLYWGVDAKPRMPLANLWDNKGRRIEPVESCNIGTGECCAFVKDVNGIPLFNKNGSDFLRKTFFVPNPIKVEWL